jgi:transposase
MERKQYDREFKAQAVQMCEQAEVPVAQIARELGISVKMLYRWREEARQTGANAFPGHGHSSDEDHKRLRRELARVEMAPRGYPDILKKALGVFAQPPK